MPYINLREIGLTTAIQEPKLSSVREQSPANEKELTACLGIESWGKCKYDPHSPGVYFSLGDIAAVLALLIAFSQFASPLHRFRWRLSITVKRIAIGLFAGSVVCVITASILPAVLGTVLPMVGFPIFWEVLGTVLLVICTLCTFTVLFKSPVFGERNASRYFEEVRRLIRRGDPQSLGALAEDVEASIKILSKFSAGATLAASRKQLLSPTQVSAIYTLDLLADSSFSRLLVDSYPDQTMALMGEMYSDDRGRWGWSVYSELIHQAFLSPNSLLNREGDYVGLGRQKDFENLVFGNYAVVEGYYRPLQAPRFHEFGVITSAVTKRYGECVNTAIQSYFDSGMFHDPANALRVGAETLARLAGDHLRVTAKNVSEAEFWRSDAYRKAREIAEALGQMLRTAQKFDHKLPVFDAPPAGELANREEGSPYAVWTLGIFSFLEECSWIEGHDEAMRSLLIGLWIELSRSSNVVGQNRCLNEVQTRLSGLLVERIEFNLEQQAYPPMVRILIGLVGLNDDPNTGDQRFFEREFHQKLRESFLVCHAADPDYAKRLLPKNVSLLGGSILMTTPNYRSGKVSYFRLEKVPPVGRQNP